MKKHTKDAPGTNRTLGDPTMVKILLAIVGDKPERIAAVPAQVQDPEEPAGGPLFEPMPRSRRTLLMERTPHVIRELRDEGIIGTV